MSSPRSLVRRFLRDALAHEATAPAVSYGWNARFPAIASALGLGNIQLDFAPSSTNVISAQLGGIDGVEITSLIHWPCVSIYTSSAQNRNIHKAQKFSGIVIGHIDFWWRQEGGMEIDDTEMLPDAIEQCLIDIFSGSNPALAAVMPAGVAYGGDMQSARPPITLLPDGYEQQIPFQFACEVHL